MNQGGSDGAAAAIEFRFQHDARSQPGRTRLQIQNIRSQQDRFEQRLQVLALLRGNLNHFGVAAPLNRIKPLLSEFLSDSIRIGIGLVDLIDGHHDRNACGASVFDRLDSLRHHAVISGDNQHHHVGCLRAAGPHQRKRFVARRVEKHYATLFIVVVGVGDFDAVGANVLGNATGLAGNDVGGANRIE